MQTLSEIKQILESRGAMPKRSLGQNFLTDHNLIRKLVDSCDVKPGDLVLEVGPGTGTMTEELLDRGARVIACELDDTLAELNRERLAARLIERGEDGSRFTLVHGDCLDGKHAMNREVIRLLGGREFKLVANLPYGAGTPLMSALMVQHPECVMMGVTVQREVADRLLAGPGSKDYGALAVIAQATMRVERVATAPPECFWPRPEVTSSMVRLSRLAEALTSDVRGLSGACRVLFSQRRKQLGSLVKGVHWEEVAQAPGCDGIVSTLRAEQLTVRQVVALSAALKSRLADGSDLTD